MTDIKKVFEQFIQESSWDGLAPEEKQSLHAFFDLGGHKEDYEALSDNSKAYLSSFYFITEKDFEL